MATTHFEFKRSFCEKLKTSLMKKDKLSEADAKQKTIAAWTELEGDEKEFQRKLKQYTKNMEKKRKAADLTQDGAPPAKKSAGNPNKHSGVVAPETGNDNRFRVNYSETGIPFFVNMRTGAAQWNMPENMLTNFLGSDFMDKVTTTGGAKRKSKREPRAPGTYKIHGYQMFVKKFKKSDGEPVNNKERMRLAAQMWNSLDDNEKNEWKEKAIAETERVRNEELTKNGASGSGVAAKDKESAEAPKSKPTAKKAKTEPLKENVVKIEAEEDEWTF